MCFHNFFWLSTCPSAPPLDDIASKYGQGILWKGELGSNLGQPRTGDQNHTLHSPCSFLPASVCVWLSVLICDLYSFPIIVFMLDQAFSTNSSFSKSFLWTHRYAFRSMKPRNSNALQHTAKERSHTESTMKLAPKWKRKFLCQGPAPFHALSSRCLRAAVLSPPWGQPLRDSHSPDDFCQERLMPLVWYGLNESKQ